MGCFAFVFHRRSVIICYISSETDVFFIILSVTWHCSAVICLSLRMLADAVKCACALALTSLRPWLFWFLQQWAHLTQQPPMCFFELYFAVPSCYFWRSLLSFMRNAFLIFPDMEFVHCTWHGQEQAIKPEQASYDCSEEGNSAVVRAKGSKIGSAMCTFILAAFHGLL